MTVERENRLMARVTELEAQVRVLQERADNAPSCPVCAPSGPHRLTPVGNHPAGRAGWEKP